MNSHTHTKTHVTVKLKMRRGNYNTMSTIEKHLKIVPCITNQASKIQKSINKKTKVNTKYAKESCQEMGMQQNKYSKSKQVFLFNITSSITAI